MNTKTAICTYAAGALLALTAGANATNTTKAGDRPDAGSRPLWLAQAQPNEPRKIFSGVGIVTAIKPAGTLTINHEPIEGLMPAMEMTFSVSPPALTKGVHPGDKVEFSVVGKTFTIVGLKVTGHAR